MRSWFATRTLPRPPLVLLALSWLVPATSTSQDSPPRLQGTVSDSVTGAVIAQAMVLLEGRGPVLTDGNGRYTLDDIPIGEYLVAAVTRDCRITAVRLRLEDWDPVRLELNVGVQRLAGADDAITRARAEGVAVRVTTREEIQRLGERSHSAILRRLAPSMVGPAPSRPGGAVELRERGVSTLRGSRTPLVLLDGVRVADLRILEGIDAGSVTRIEIAAGATGGWAYGLEGVNGIIHIRTHEGDPAQEPYCGAASRRG